MAYDESGRPRRDEPQADDEPLEGLRRSVLQVRKNVLRTLVEELRQEIESMDAVARHGKADEHTKGDWYFKTGAVASVK